MPPPPAPTPAPSAPTRPRSRLLGLLLAVRLRCPHCRKSGLYRRPYVLHAHCPVCGLAFERDEGDFWGGVVFSYVYAGVAGLALAALLIVLGVTRWDWIAYAAAGTAALTALAVFPFAKAQWITLLYLTRGHYEEYRPPRP
jgi:uncharacterized protein (DUF983 family)